MGPNILFGLHRDVVLRFLALGTGWGLIWDVAPQAASEIAGVCPNWSSIAYGASIVDAGFLCWVWVQRVNRAYEEGEFD